MDLCKLDIVVEVATMALKVVFLWVDVIILLHIPVRNISICMIFACMYIVNIAMFLKVLCVVQQFSRLTKSIRNPQRCDSCSVSVGVGTPLIARLGPYHNRPTKFLQARIPYWSSGLFRIQLQAHLKQLRWSHSVIIYHYKSITAVLMYSTYSVIVYYFNFQLQTNQQSLMYQPFSAFYVSFRLVV